MDITLADGGIETWIIYADELACAREFDLSHSGWLLRNRRTLYRCVRERGCWVGRQCLPEAKNVTILGLPGLHRGLHIVCPKDSQRYYLLFTTRIPKLFAQLYTRIRTLFRTSTPYCHDSTKTRNPARLT